MLITGLLPRAPWAALERVKVRDVAGVFRTREEIDKMVDALLLAGFDRADIDLMATVDAVKEKLGGIYRSAKELADDPRVSRKAYIARDGVHTAPVCRRHADLCRRDGRGVRRRR